jgi:hypothetical protein
MMATAGTGVVCTSASSPRQTYSVGEGQRHTVTCAITGLCLDPRRGCVVVDAAGYADIRVVPDRAYGHGLTGTPAASVAVDPEGAGRGKEANEEDAELHLG